MKPQRQYTLECMSSRQFNVKTNIETWRRCSVQSAKKEEEDFGVCTVRVISPVQSEHTCSEMRYCNHRYQCPWRCFTAREDNKHTLVGLSRPPRKANVAPGKCRSTEQFSQTISAVKTGVQVESMLVRKRLLHRYPALTMVCAKTGQLSTVVSSFDSKAMA